MKTMSWIRFGIVAAIAFIALALRADETIWMEGAPAKPLFHAQAMFRLPDNKLIFWTVPVSGARPIRFTAEDLPPGLTINEKSGTITGLASAEGSYISEITASNSVGRARTTIRFVVGRGIAPTPPMGWNSYDCFGDNVTEAEVLANAKYMAEKMLPFGWDTVVVDYCWYDPGAHDNNRNARVGAALSMDAYGRLIPATNRFPSATGDLGFKPLAGAVHAMGLRFGIHIMRGIPRNAVRDNLPIEGSQFKACEAADTNSLCPWCPDMFGVRGDTPAGRAYYNSIIRLYAGWGVDYIKMDDTSFPYATNEINAVRDAIGKSKRPIVFSLSPGETPIEQAAHVESHANLWRVSADFWDEWKPLTNAFTLGARWREHVAPGHWPDADMLPLGHLSVGGRCVGPDRQTRFTHSEQLTLMSLWALLPSPLMVGANLPDNDPWTLALLTNPEVIDVNQDYIGSAGTPVLKKGKSAIWTKKLSHKRSLAVGLFNTDDFEQTITADWSTLGLKGPQIVRDLWSRKSLGTMDGKYIVTVPAHGAVLLRFTGK